MQTLQDGVQFHQQTLIALVVEAVSGGCTVLDLGWQVGEKRFVV